MKLILGGGGDEVKSFNSHKLFYDQLGTNKKVLYIPIALLSKNHSAESCFEWFSNAFKEFTPLKIDMLKDFKGITSDKLDLYGGIYIGGGNTYKLLKEIKSSSFYTLLENYLNGTGVVYGGSAGAIIFGQDIETVKFADSNEVGLDDLHGFNVLNDYCIWCHYNTYDLENISQLTKEGVKIIALEEDSALYIDGGRLFQVGNGVHLFASLTEQPFTYNKLTDLP